MNNLSKGLLDVRGIFPEDEVIDLSLSYKPNRNDVVCLLHVLDIENFTVK